MSTFLQLCQDTARECDLGGGDTSLTTIAGQTGDLRRIVKWVEQAWTDIQNRHIDWRWMRVGFTVNTVSGDDSYSPGDCTDDLTSSAIVRFAKWRINASDDPPKIFLQSSGVGGESWLIYSPWDWFKSIYKIGTQTNSSPAHITIDPQNNLVLGPKPDNVYTVSGDYRRSPQILAIDGDTPDMPSQFHNLIVYRAMQKYGLFESADEVVLRSQVEGQRVLRQLEADQLPDLLVAAPLA